MSKTIIHLILIFFEKYSLEKRYLYPPIFKFVCEDNIETPSMLPKDSLQNKVNLLGITG